MEPDLIPACKTPSNSRSMSLMLQRVSRRYLRPMFISDIFLAIWFFCKSPTHCGLGMVGSINAPATGNTFDNFQAAAVKIGSNEVTVSACTPFPEVLYLILFAVDSRQRLRFRECWCSCYCVPCGDSFRLSDNTFPYHHLWCWTCYRQQRSGIGGSRCCICYACMISLHGLDRRHVTLLMRRVDSVKYFHALPIPIDFVCYC